MKVYFHFYNCFIIVPLLMFQLGIITYCALILTAGSHSTNARRGGGGGSAGFSPSPGSVLFPGGDEPACWSRHQLALLRARRLLHAAVPNADAVDFNRESDVRQLLRYLRTSVLASDRHTSAGPATEVVAQALADAIGGYLKYWALPAARLGYYAGTVSFDTVSSLSELYDDICQSLQTDGATWRAPDYHALAELRVSAFPVPPPTGDSRRERQICANLTFVEMTSSEFSIPMPHINWDYSPHMIALPTVQRSLLALEDPDAAYVLYDYYTIADNCLTAKRAWKERDEFRERFREWAIHWIIPRLEDDALYVAFGSILRIVNGTGDGTLLTKRLPSIPLDSPIFQNAINRLPILLGALAILWCAPLGCYCILRHKDCCPPKNLQESAKRGNGQTMVALVRHRYHIQSKADNTCTSCAVLESGNECERICEKWSHDMESNNGVAHKNNTCQHMTKTSRPNSVTTVNVSKDVRRTASSAETTAAVAASIANETHSREFNKPSTQLEMDLKAMEADRLNDVLDYFNNIYTKSENLVPEEVPCTEMPSSIITLSPMPATPFAVEQAPKHGRTRSTPDVMSQSALAQQPRLRATSAAETGKPESEGRERPSRIPQKQQTTLISRRLSDAR